MLWLTAGMLVICLSMIVGLLALVLTQGVRTFWPVPVYRMTTQGGDVLMGELDQVESARVASGDDGVAAEQVDRRRYRTGNFSLLASHFTWVDDKAIQTIEQPTWGMVVELFDGGRFYGVLAGVREAGEVVTSDAAEAWKRLQAELPVVAGYREERESLERTVVGPINRSLADARRRQRQAVLDHGEDSSAAATAADQVRQQEANAEARLGELRTQIESLSSKADRWEMVLETTTDPAYVIKLSNVVRMYPANRLTLAEKWDVYRSRWWEFVSADPRESNSEGGVFPAIVGTLVMTVIMSIAVVPFGVLAALYLREYAKAGWAVSLIRIAINNLAGVPSIVFGVFGLGFFVYWAGGSIDRAFFAAEEGPVFGQGGVLWASLTMALLTLPVVIVATEESLSAVPNSMREGSYACGASKWQTIWRIILPRATPGVLTGLILAVARGAGEVAPLMLVGVLDHAPELPVDEFFPYVHPDRSFMHLGFSIYHMAFKSTNSEAAKPLVFTITLLLIVLIALLNLLAIGMRSRLRRRYATGAF
jgi:phosphate transport system permease protein